LNLILSINLKLEKQQNLI